MLTTSILSIGKLAAILAAATALPVYGGIAIYMTLIWREGRRR